MKYLKISNEFFDLYNNGSCIKRILFNYFTEFKESIASNTDPNSCYSNYNKSLELPTPKRTIYYKKGATLNARKNYILDRLEKWA